MAIVSFSSHAVAVTPSDSVNFPAGACKGLYIGGAGNVAAIVGGAVVLFTAPAVGSILPIQATRVNATATTATQLIALY